MKLIRPPRDPAESLLWRTGIRLSAITLLMLAALVIIVGATTAVVATALMRESIDRTLDAAVSDPVALHELFDDDEGEYDGPLSRADTFVVLVDANGNVYGSTTSARLTGLPDMAALDAAASGDDRRSGTYGSAHLRLLTTRSGVAELEDELEDDRDATTALFLQAGHDLSLQTELERQLLLAISLIGLLGIAGAVVVTLFVTRRALVPIREAFETERRFVATASHELRTPVAIIRASAEILERERLVAASGRALVDDIVSETDRMGRLVGDLMALASAEAGAVSMDLEPVALQAYFDDIARRCASIAESRGVDFAATSDQAGPTVWVRADRDRLDQLLLILVDNAFKHAPPSGHVRMHLAIERPARTATISVSDDGPGIAADAVERIFEPFERLTPRRGAEAGAGLGLAIARQLARRHDAELSVESIPDHGATFRLRLPLLADGGGLTAPAYRARE